VENTLPTKANVLLQVENKVAGWDIDLSEKQFVMPVRACAREVSAKVSPTATHPQGTEAIFFVTAYAAPWGTEDFEQIGGVALKARYLVREVPRSRRGLAIVGIVVLAFGWYWFFAAKRQG
jgi:hypothetical protein